MELVGGHSLAFISCEYMILVQYLHLDCEGRLAYVFVEKHRLPSIYHGRALLKTLSSSSVMPYHAIASLVYLFL